MQCKDCKFYAESWAKEGGYCGIRLPTWLLAALPPGRLDTRTAENSYCDLGQPKETKEQ